MLPKTTSATKGVTLPRRLARTSSPASCRNATPSYRWRLEDWQAAGPAVFPGVVGGSAQVFLAGPYMILYRVDRGRPAALVRDLRPSPGDLARRGPEINSTPLASPGMVASLFSLQGAHEI